MKDVGIVKNVRVVKDVGIVKNARIVKIVNSAAICKMLNIVMIIFNTHKKNIWIKLK